VDLWRARPAKMRHRDDVLLFYGWLVEHEPRLVPIGSGAIEHVRRLVEDDIVQSDVLLASGNLPVEGETYWVIPNRNGDLIAASEAAAGLLGARGRGLRGRNLMIFFERDRDEWRARSATVTTVASEMFEPRLRPKETRPISVLVSLVALGPSEDSQVKWTFAVPVVGSKKPA
jgi:hypothetical protein